jgi:hypothetical protein
MNSNWAVVTVVTRNYLHFARALAASVRQVHPEVSVVVCLVDELPPGFSVEDEFQILPASSLGIPRWRRFLFQYEPFELTCALKSFLLAHLLRTKTFDRLLYLDADIAVYSSLLPLIDALDHANILLTPQLAAPRNVAALDRWEADILDTGVYNGGFVGVKNSAVGLQMLAWWQTRVARHSKRNINCDQGWLDAVPAIFDGVHIERGAPFNLTPQNLHNRIVSRDASGRPLVDGQPLSFFHFVGIDPLQSATLSKSSRRPLSEEALVVQELYKAYVRELHNRGLGQCIQLGYGHARLVDGSLIQESWRELIRLDHPAFSSVEDPFAISGKKFQRIARNEKIKMFAGKIRRGIKQAAGF